MFVHSATSGGATSNDPLSLLKGYPQRTIFENLDEEDISFGIYYQNIPAVLIYQSLRNLKYGLKFHSYALSFKNHAKEGKLPAYTVIEQRYMDTILEPATDDHPSHDVYQGQVRSLIFYRFFYLFKKDIDKTEKYIKNEPNQSKKKIYRFLLMFLIFD